MPIIGGVTPKGTIFVKNFDVNGRLLSKRVLKNHTQYDTLFNPKTKKYKMMLTTDWVTQRQFMQLAPMKMKWWMKAMSKIIAPKKPVVTAKKSDGKLYEIFSPMDMDVLMTKGKKGQMSVGYYQGITGFQNKQVNEETQRIKSEYLKSVFR